jgi:phosphatidylglycerophosphate synthase
MPLFRLYTHNGGKMRSVQSGPMLRFAAVVVLLGVLAASVGLGVPGWLTGLACGSVITLLLTRGMASAQVAGLGMADRVTLTRAVLACGVAALTAQSFVAPSPARTLIGLSAVALVLDALDGQVARRTGTTSRFGARFDMEVDAFLILVLSAYVAHATAWWVLAIGLARYVFWAARLVLPELHGSAPPRRWCKLVAAVQGIMLTVVAADILPVAAGQIALAVALAMLTESFGREAWELWRADASARARQVAPVGNGAVRDG